MTKSKEKMCVCGHSELRHIQESNTDDEETDADYIGTCIDCSCTEFEENYE